MRLSRLAPLGAGVAVGFFGARGVMTWMRERREKSVFPASDAPALLNPLRQAIMPSAKTLDRFGVAEGQVVLEVGPGPGYYSIEASRRVGTGGRLVCLDLQREMIQVLRGRLADAGADAEAGVADATHLPLRDASIDVAYLVTVLGEVPDPEAAVAELRRVLKTGGTLGFSESIGDPDYVRLGRLQKMCREAGFEESSRYRDPLGYTITFRAA
jgi:SAM-dependent methyltransferase